PKSSKPSNFWPKEVSRNLCMAAFQRSPSGKTGGNRFWAGMARAFPRMPKRGEWGTIVRVSVKPCQLPAYFMLRYEMGRHEAPIASRAVAKVRMGRLRRNLQLNMKGTN